MRQASPQKAAIYARFSTDLQRDRSIDDQVALCRGFAARQGLTVSEIYFDRAKTSASILGRDGLMRLMDDARDGRFDVVIVEALDRVSRDQEDLAGIFKRLSFLGIEIVGVHDGVADAMQVGIRGLVGSLFLTDLKHKVRRGLQGVIRDGRHAGGRAYGYRPVMGKPGELEIVPEEAEVIRRIFTEFLAGSSPRTIAGRLNAEGVPPPRGARWNASTINGSRERGNGIILNPIYHGKIVWNRVTMIRDPDTGKRVSRPNPESEWHTADAPHLAIIDADTWEKAKAKRERRSIAHTEGRKARAPKRILSGLLRCGCCGSGMAIHDYYKNSVRIRCSRSRESGSCTNEKRYRLDIIERGVIDRLREQFAHPAYLKEYVRIYCEERRGDVARATRERATVERQFAEAETAFKRKMDLYSRGVIDGEEAEREIRELLDRKRMLEARLKAAQVAEPVIEMHPKAIDQYRRLIDDLAGRIGTLDPLHDRDALEAFRSIIAEVTVFEATGDGIEIEVAAWLTALTGTGSKGEQRPFVLGGVNETPLRYHHTPQICLGRFRVAA